MFVLRLGSSAVVSVEFRCVVLVVVVVVWVSVAQPAKLNRTIAMTLLAKGTRVFMRQRKAEKLKTGKPEIAEAANAGQARYRSGIGWSAVSCCQ